MDNKFIFFQWHGARIPRWPDEDEYGCLIMRDAVETGLVTLYTGPRFLRNEQNFYIFEEFIEAFPYINMMLSEILYPFLIPKHINKGQVICFNEHHYLVRNMNFLRWIKKRYNAKLALIVRNPMMNKKYASILGIDVDEWKKIFDVIVTDEKEDAERCNLVYLPDSFSIPKDIDKGIENDLCFVGTDQNRRLLLEMIASEAKKNNIKYDIKIVGNPRRTGLLDYISFMSYKELLDIDLKSNCILEILQPIQTSYTLRYQEAVCLNKKLLTNNARVKDEKYYNPRYIQIFENVEDIDWEFVKQPINVDYGYEGDFSPILFLRTIESEIERNGK